VHNRAQRCGAQGGPRAIQGVGEQRLGAKSMLLPYPTPHMNEVLATVAGCSERTSRTSLPLIRPYRVTTAFTPTATSAPFATALDRLPR